jgi:hypothetical protein
VLQRQTSRTRLSHKDVVVRFVSTWPIPQNELQARSTSDNHPTAVSTTGEKVAFEIAVGRFPGPDVIANRGAIEYFDGALKCCRFRRGVGIANFYIRVNPNYTMLDSRGCEDKPVVCFPSCALWRPGTAY